MVTETDVNIPQGPGAQLRAERERQERTIESVAYELRLTTQVIENLEGDGPVEQKSRTFTRGYLRSYARLLNLDPDMILSAFDRTHRPVAPELPAALAPAEQKRTTKPLEGMHPRQMVAGGVAVLSLVLVVGSFMGPSEAPETATPVEAETVAAEVASTESVVQAVASSARLKIQFKEDCWVTIFDDTQARIATGMMSSENPLEVDGIPPFKVMLGDASAPVDFEINGQSLEVALPEDSSMVNLTLG